MAAAWPQQLPEIYRLGAPFIPASALPASRSEAARLGDSCSYHPMIGERLTDSRFLADYSNQLEDAGNVYLAFEGTIDTPSRENPFLNGVLEIEYGVTAWWTTEVYLSGQNTSGESTLFTGHRWENRFRPLMREHWINPVLYLEYADVNGADKSLKEVVGHDGMADQSEPNATSRLG